MVRYVLSIGFRHLKEFTIGLRKTFSQLLSIDHSWVRRGFVRLSVALEELRGLKRSRAPIAIVLDSIGVKASRADSWLERRYERKRDYVKIHI